MGIMTAAIGGGNKWKTKNKFFERAREKARAKIKMAKDAASFASGKVPSHGEEAHSTGGAIGNETAVTEPVVAEEEATASVPNESPVADEVEASPAAFKSSPAKSTKASPAKDMKTGDYSHSFEMKAKSYNNSPIEKNYGSVKSRFPASASAVPYSSSLGGVGSSPAKGWFKKLRKKLNPINVVKKMMGKKTGLLGKLNKTLGIGGGEEMKPHGDEMHTGGDATAAGGVGEAVAGAAAGMPPDKTNVNAASIAAKAAATGASGQSAGAGKWDMLRASGAGAGAGAEEEEVV